MIINNASKRILFSYMLGKDAGGSDTCLYLLLKNLDQTKYDPYLLYRDSSSLVEDLRVKGIKLIEIPHKIKAKLHLKLIKNSEEINQSIPKVSPLKLFLKRTGYFGLLLSNLKNTIKNLPEIFTYISIITKNKIDIVHTNHYLAGDRSMLIAAIILRKKVVSHNRGLYKPDVVDRFISKYVDQIVNMSNFSKSVYVENGVGEEKCKTIYDGIDTEKFKSLKNENDKMIVGCIGRIEKWKGQQVLVDAAEIIVKIYPDIKFLLIGTGDNEIEIKNKVKAKNLEKYFEFTGHITNVIDHIERCTIIAHTSIVPEPFGMVIIEAMSLEKIVIATNFGGPVEIIDNGSDGFLIPHENPQRLAEIIINLTKDLDLQEQIRKNAREKILTKFDVKLYAKQIEKLYQELTT